MVKKNLLIKYLFILILLISFANAEIVISQPKEIYNLGSEFSTELQINDFQEGYFDVDLICKNPEIMIKNLYHGILSEKAIQISRRLTPVYIGVLKGECYIEARYGADIQTSQIFKISENLNIELELKNMEYTAGEEVKVRGRITREDGITAGTDYPGLVEIKIGEESKANGIIKDGAFEINFSISDTTLAGNYELNISAYEKDAEGNILSKGEDTADIIIQQIPSWIEIAIDTQIIDPGQELLAIPILYDKANNELLEQEMIISIIDSQNRKIVERIIKSKEEFRYILESDHKPGYSKINVQKGNISQEKIFEVKEKGKIEAKIINGTLVIKNIGNAFYDGAFEIKIGEETIVKEAKLGVEEIKKYDISAPDGDYQVIIKNNQGTLAEGTHFLTGKAVSVEDRNNRSNIFTSYPLVWMMIVVILIASAFILYKNIKKKKNYARPMKEREEYKSIAEKKSLFLKNFGFLKKENEFEKKNLPAEQVLVLNGVKQESGVLSIKIKNHLAKISRKTLERAFELAGESKGAISEKEENIFIIFSPSNTKTMENSKLAVKMGMKINKMFREHNLKFEEKIEYGIGVNSGNIIGRKENGIFKFTGTGNVLGIARKISEIASNEILISHAIRERTISIIKACLDKDKSIKGKFKIYRIERDINRDEEANQEFVREFMRRNEK